jgi:hypothetical protein
VGLGLYLLYLARTFGSPFVFSRADAPTWRSHFTPPWALPGVFLTGFMEVGHRGQIGVAHFALNLVAILFFIGMVVVVWRMLPFSYTAFSLAVLAYLLSFTADDPTAAVAGLGRYVLLIFPAFMALGVWGERKWIHHALLIGMLPLLAILCAHFLLGLANT